MQSHKRKTHQVGGLVRIKCLHPDCDIVYKCRQSMLDHLKKKHPELYEIELKNREIRKNAKKAGSEIYRATLAQKVLDPRLSKCLN